MTLQKSLVIFLLSLLSTLLLTHCSSESPKLQSIQLDSTTVRVKTFLFEEDSQGTHLTLYGKFTNTGTQPYVIDTASLVLEDGAKNTYSFSECHPYKVTDSADFFMIYHLPPRHSSAHYFIMYARKNGKPVSDTLKFSKSYRSEG